MTEAERKALSLKTLLADISVGLDGVSDAAARVSKALERSGADLFLRASSCGLYLQAAYTAMEEIFTRIAQEFSGGVPAGENWHRRLGELMARPIPEVRPAVISAETLRLIDEYRRFRHRVRHAYSEELDWDRMERLVADLPRAVEGFRREIGSFVGFVRALIDGLESAP